METKLRLEILAKWLQEVTTSDFGYDVRRMHKPYLLELQVM